MSGDDPSPGQKGAAGKPSFDTAILLGVLSAPLIAVLMASGDWTYIDCITGAFVAGVTHHYGGRARRGSFFELLAYSLVFGGGLYLSIGVFIEPVLVTVGWTGPISGFAVCADPAGREFLCALLKPGLLLIYALVWLGFSVLTFLTHITADQFDEVF